MKDDMFELLRKIWRHDWSSQLLYNSISSCEIKEPEKKLGLKRIQTHDLCNVLFQKIFIQWTPPTEGFLAWTPPPHPSGNSILLSYFRSKNWAFETPLPLGIFVNFPSCGHGYFLELHNWPFRNSSGNWGEFQILTNWQTDTATWKIMLRLIIWKRTCMMLLGWTETKLWTLKYGSKSIQTSIILRQRPPKSYKLLKCFTSSNHRLGSAGLNVLEELLFRCWQ